MNGFSVNYIIEQFDYFDKDEASQSDYESSKSEYHQSEDEYADEKFSEGLSYCSTNTPEKTVFIVYWSSMILFRICLNCSLPATTKNVTFNGSQLIVKLICPNKHENCNLVSIDIKIRLKGNLTTPAAVLLSTNTFEKLKIISILLKSNGLKKLVTMQFRRNYEHELYI